MESNQQVSFFNSFIRSHIGAITATSVDMSTLFFLTEVVGVYYVISAGIASACGEVVSFSILRYWAFKQVQKPIFKQALKYAIVSALILVLNMVGIYLFTDLLSFQYMISKVFCAVLIGVFVSFPLFRYYVYR